MSRIVLGNAQIQGSQNLLTHKPLHRGFTSQYIHVVGSEDLDFNSVVAKLIIFAFPIIASLALFLDFLSTCCQTRVVTPLSQNLLYGQRPILTQKPLPLPSRERPSQGVSPHHQKYAQPAMAVVQPPPSTKLFPPTALSVSEARDLSENHLNSQTQARPIPANIAVRTPQPMLVLNPAEEGSPWATANESKEQEEQNAIASPKDLAGDFQEVSHEHATPENLRASPHCLQTPTYTGWKSPLNYLPYMPFYSPISKQ